jgi:hypothetical protein
MLGIPTTGQTKQVHHERKKKQQKKKKKKKKKITQKHIQLGINTTGHRKKHTHTHPHIHRT